MGWVKHPEVSLTEDVQPAPKDHPWRSMRNPNGGGNGMTMHISGTSLDAQKRYADGTKEIIKRFYAGEQQEPANLIVENGEVSLVRQSEAHHPVCHQGLWSEERTTRFVSKRGGDGCAQVIRWSERRRCITRDDHQRLPK